MSFYKVLNKQKFSEGQFSIVPIRYKDRIEIMNWRNEQIYHLRQVKILTSQDQERYFNEVVSELFDQTEPKQLLFSYLYNDVCIGYGGLVHINWIDKNAEISFIMKTELEHKEFELHWSNYLRLIEVVAFEQLGLHKVFTYAFDLRPHLYVVIEKLGYFREATLSEHYYFNKKFINVVIHSKTDFFNLREATEHDEDITLQWANSSIIRQFSFDKSFICLEDHKKWFHNKINSKKCKYLILENRLNTPLGSIRLDFENSVATISYLISPRYHGRGLGRLVLELAEKYVLDNNIDINTLQGYVMEANLASIKIFKSLDYIKDFSDKGLKFFKNIHENR